MFKDALLVAASALAIAVFVAAATGSGALAEVPKCKNKGNKYVACTDKLKAKTPQQRHRKIIEGYSSEFYAGTRIEKKPAPRLQRK